MFLLRYANILAQFANYTVLAKILFCIETYSPGHSRPAASKSMAAHGHFQAGNLQENTNRMDS